MTVAEEEIKKPFEHADRLTALLKEQAELNAELDIGKREEIIMDDSKEENIVVKTLRRAIRAQVTNRLSRWVCSKD